MYILIVEDDPNVAANLAELLTNEGHEAAIAASVAAARVSLKGRKPQIVFLDVYLPDGKGLDLLGDIDGIPFIVVTGSPDEATVDVAFNSGVVAYLVKPFLPDDVLEAIAEVSG